MIAEQWACSRAAAEDASGIYLSVVAGPFLVLSLNVIYSFVWTGWATLLHLTSMPSHCCRGWTVSSIRCDSTACQCRVDGSMRAGPVHSFHQCRSQSFSNWSVTAQCSLFVSSWSCDPTVAAFGVCKHCQHPLVGIVKENQVQFCPIILVELQQSISRLGVNG